MRSLVVHLCSSSYKTWHRVSADNLKGSKERSWVSVPQAWRLHAKQGHGRGTPAINDGRGVNRRSGQSQSEAMPVSAREGYGAQACCTFHWRSGNGALHRESHDAQRGGWGWIQTLALPGKPLLRAPAIEPPAACVLPDIKLRHVGLDIKKRRAVQDVDAFDRE